MVAVSHVFWGDPYYIQLGIEVRFVVLFMYTSLSFLHHSVLKASGL